MTTHIDRAARMTPAEAIDRLTPIDLTMVRIRLAIDETLARTNGLSVAERIGRTVAEVAPAVWPRLETIYRRAFRGEPACDVDISVPSATEPLRAQQ
jgi:hypothetical protein